MTYSVSSGFISTAKQNTAPFKRLVTIAGSDYSSRVIRWPQFQNVSDRINIDNVSLNFANTDQVFSHFPANPALMEQQVLVKIGFDYSTSSTEYITLFDGKVDSFRMIGGSIQINAVNKFAQLSNRTIGSVTTPTNYTGSDYAPSDLAWYLITSHGGLSAITSTSNPDIDYAAYTSWTAANSASPMLFRARFQGERAIDATERLAKASRSSVLIENGRLKFIQIPSTPGTLVDSFTYDNTIQSDVLFDKRAMFNRYYVGADLDVTSQYFKTTVVAANSASVNSYSARDSNLWDKTVWHANSTSAQRLADFWVTAYGTPKAQATVRTPLATAFVGIGDSVTFMDSNSNIYGSFAVKRETIDMEGATKTYLLENVSQNVTPITLDLPFAETETLPVSVTFTRATTGTYTNGSGVITSAAIDEPRFDHDPATGESLGLLIEESRTNLLLNSDIIGTNLATQNITTTAAARTLSFYGTGTITLTGTHSATVVGTGAYPTRTTYTYTPTAGTLTLTVTGTVQYAQDELGAFATSFIPTAGTPLTRSADVASMTGTNFSSWYNQTDGTFVCRFKPIGALAAAKSVIGVTDGTSSNYMYLGTRNGSAAYGTNSRVGGGTIETVGSFGAVDLLSHTTAYAYKSGSYAATQDASAVATGVNTVPTVDRLGIGNFNSTITFNGHISRITYFPIRLGNTTLQALSS